MSVFQKAKEYAKLSQQGLEIVASNLLDRAEEASLLSGTEEAINILQSIVAIKITDSLRWNDDGTSKEIGEAALIKEIERIETAALEDWKEAGDVYRKAIRLPQEEGLLREWLPEIAAIYCTKEERAGINEKMGGESARKITGNLRGYWANKEIMDRVFAGEGREREGMAVIYDI